MKYAYNKVLSDRHNVFIRNAFKVAVIVCPSKATFLTKISGNLSKEEVDHEWVVCEKNMKTISDRMWEFFKKEEMAELPSSVCYKSASSKGVVSFSFLLKTTCITLCLFLFSIEKSAPASLNSSIN